MTVLTPTVRRSLERVRAFSVGLLFERQLINWGSLRTKLISSHPGNFMATIRTLMTGVETNLSGIASSSMHALSDARRLAGPGPLLCLAFNILLISGGGVLCVAAYGFAGGLGIVVLALAPALMLLNIALFAWVEEGRRPGPVRAISTSTQASQRSETLDEKYPSIVPEKSETALDEKAEPARHQQKERNRKRTVTAKPQIDTRDP